MERIYVGDGGADYAKAYVDERFHDRVAHIYRPKADFLAESCGRAGPGSLLDVGCGAGFFVFACLERGIRAQGVDVSERMVAAGNAQLDLAFGARPLARVDEDGFYDRIIDADVDVISAIGVIEHLREPGRFFDAFARSRARQVFFSVPMFSCSALFENVLPGVFPRQLSGAHTHLFTERSLAWMYEAHGWAPAAEWRFGTDMMDLYRSLVVSLKANGGSDRLIDLFATGMGPAIDPMQASLDAGHFCSEIHVLAGKRG